MRPGAIRSSDFAKCSEPAGQETHIQGLEHIATANVERVSIEVHESGSPDPGGFCYGYRREGVWTWVFDEVPWAHDADTESYRVDLVVHQENVDAIRVISTASPKRFTMIKYSTF